jgi:hypothetical protein
MILREMKAEGKRTSNHSFMPDMWEVESAGRMYLTSKVYECRNGMQWLYTSFYRVRYDLSVAKTLPCRFSFTPFPKKEKASTQNPLTRN